MIENELVERERVVNQNLPRAFAMLDHIVDKRLFQYLHMSKNSTLTITRDKYI